jgi:hypothetical protein
MSAAEKRRSLARAEGPWSGSGLDPCRELARVLEGAAPIPLTEDRRLDYGAARFWSAELRRTLAAQDLRRPLLERFEAELESASVVPLTDHVRLPASRIAEVSAGLTT